jgi:hypothetical protein
MKNFLLFAISIVLFLSCRQEKTDIKSDKTAKQIVPFAIVIHGGAGYIKNLPAETEKAYRNKLNEAT